MKKYLLIAAAIILVFVVVGILDLRSTSSGDSQACTTEAKICPDGSAVGRTGPNCSFAPCPTAAAPSNVATTTLSIGDKMIVNGNVVSLTGPMQDNRCSAGALCIQAGTVRVQALLNSSTTTFTLGQPETVSGEAVTLTSVTPAKSPKQTIKPSDYRFIFTIASQ